jgi:translation initiation factor IF-2
LAVKGTDVIKKLMAMGVMATMNQELDLDTATLISSEYGFELKNKEKTAEDVLSAALSTAEVGETEERPAIVTIMGHVDHGKTSLLDAIRSAKVAAGEAGGITQHIGAYTVDYSDKKIAFLDTPGHEAFSAMRSRGASLTDIVVLVVAADDGVMPQTVEAINHAKAAGVPIIVAVNKIDKPNQNLDRLYSQLAEHGIQSEEWGGENQFVKTSATQRIGIDEILDAILLQAEVLDLKAKHIGPATGAVVEAHLDKGRGPVATIMVQTGTLQIGQYVVAGREFGRVRAMIDHRGQKLEFAGPSTPVEVIGLGGVPGAGDKVNAVADERTAREIVSIREEQERKKHTGKSSAASLADLLAKVQNSDRPELAVIVKADVQGSLEAVCEAVNKLTGDKVKNRIVHKAVGGITESDIALATTTGAVILGFNVRAARGLDDLADKSGVVLRYFSIIYELVDAVKAIMAGKLPPIVTESVQGHAEVRQTISVPKIGTIAGSAVLDGKITRQSKLRLIRDSVVIYNGRISSLRRFKDDVREVVQGYECGIGIDGYADIRVGDVIEAYELQETAPTL